VKAWWEITPEDAVEIRLPAEGIVGPMNEMGEECPWPWEPQMLSRAPMGQYHCNYCGAMAVAGVPHPDYRDHFSPDCEAAKHDACSGDAWDELLDRATRCTCMCHATSATTPD